MGKKDACTRFGLIRHATTSWNLEKRIQGRLNADLAPCGEHMARRWGKRLQENGWQRILASHSGRAMQTARLMNLALKLPLSADSRLQEQDWGHWSGQRLPDLKQRYGRQLRAQVNAGWRFQPPGGEDRLAVWRRSLQALLDGSARWPGRRILVVTHEGVIKCLLYRLSGRRFLPDEPVLLKPSHLHLVKVRDDRLLLARINHLDLR